VQKAELWLVAFVSLNTLTIGPSLAADVCENASASGLKKVDDVYVPKIDLWIKVSKALEDKGIDPHKYPVIMPDGSVEVLDIPDVIKKLALQRANAYGQIEAATNDCNNEIAPYQKVTDVAVFFTTGGLSAILPPRMTHVDASQILSGHPLGGPGALVPKAREDVLKGLNIGGDVAGIIRDPLCVVRGKCL
jgi:hypothetical protein